jgi:hypothetical protein
MKYLGTTVNQPESTFKQSWYFNDSLHLHKHKFHIVTDPVACTKSSNTIKWLKEH